MLSATKGRRSSVHPTWRGRWHVLTLHVLAFASLLIAEPTRSEIVKRTFGNISFIDSCPWSQKDPNSTIIADFETAKGDPIGQRQLRKFMVYAHSLPENIGSRAYIFAGEVPGKFTFIGLPYSHAPTCLRLFYSEIKNGRLSLLPPSHAFRPATLPDSAQQAILDRRRLCRSNPDGWLFLDLCSIYRPNGPYVDQFSEETKAYEALDYVLQFDMKLNSEELSVVWFDDYLLVRE
jgi:hypothetical protein